MSRSSAVFGVAADDGEEEVAAALVLRRTDADLAGILRHAEQHLPAYAVPALMRIVEDLPRTPTAKVQKGELRSAPRECYFARAQLETGAG